MVATAEQISFHSLLSWIFLLQSIPTYLITRYVIVAPFGRHTNQKYRWWFGPKFNARISWFLFECPNLIWVWYCYMYWHDPDILFLDSERHTIILTEETEGSHHLQISTNIILLSLFTIHYINRALIYPLRMNCKSQKVPLVVTSFAGLITTSNGYLQSFFLVQIKKYPPLSLSLNNNIQCWVGIALFFTGMHINMHSDAVLRIRVPSTEQKRQQPQQSSTKDEHVYYIPQSPFFTYISCPNFSGEILEWFGFAVASQFSLPSVAFFIYTCSNLIPRAIAHHEWYRRKFEDYPVKRKWAVIPFIV